MPLGFSMASPRLAKVSFRVTHTLLRIAPDGIVWIDGFAGLARVHLIQGKADAANGGCVGCDRTSASPVNGSKGPGAFGRRKLEPDFAKSAFCHIAAICVSCSAGFFDHLKLMLSSRPPNASRKKSGHPLTFRAQTVPKPHQRSAC